MGQKYNLSIIKTKKLFLKVWRENENDNVENQGYSLAIMKNYCKSCYPVKSFHEISYLKYIYFIKLRYFSFDLIL